MGLTDPEVSMLLACRPCADPSTCGSDVFCAVCATTLACMGAAWHRGHVAPALAQVLMEGCLVAQHGSAAHAHCWQWSTVPHVCGDSCPLSRSKLHAGG